MYELFCRVVRDDLVSDAVAASANPALTVGEARFVDGYPMLRAIELPAGAVLSWPACRQSGRFIGAVSLDDDRYSNIETVSAHARAWCEAFEDVPAICAEGGGATAVVQERFGVHRTLYAHFPEVVTEIDRRLFAGQGPAWRERPSEVIKRWPEYDGLDTLCDEMDTRDFQIDCRVGMRSDGDNFRFLVQVLTKVTPPEPMFDGEEWIVTLEQQGGGPSWWVTDAERRPLVEMYSTIGADALDAHHLKPPPYGPPDPQESRYPSSTGIRSVLELPGTSFVHSSSRDSAIGAGAATPT